MPGDAGIDRREPRLDTELATGLLTGGVHPIYGVVATRAHKVVAMLRALLPLASQFLAVPHLESDQPNRSHH